MRGFEPKKKWQRLGLNQRPRAYESPALPLSYAASKENISLFYSECQRRLMTCILTALKVA